ncbi:hypothetical protein AADR41_41170, partial [Streptomyces sp. CLV115]|uniref:hypothetical protein n=1 Tax=Streptomyces sp. CLV115 TaxID=3138502 RepID=UPI00313EF14A
PPRPHPRPEVLRYPAAPAPRTGARSSRRASVIALAADRTGQPASRSSLFTRVLRAVARGVLRSHRYIHAVVDQLRAEDHEIRDEDIARHSPSTTRISTCSVLPLVGPYRC